MIVTGIVWSYIHTVWTSSDVWFLSAHKLLVVANLLTHECLIIDFLYN